MHLKIPNSSIDFQVSLTGAIDCFPKLKFVMSNSVIDYATRNSLNAWLSIEYV